MASIFGAVITIVSSRFQTRSFTGIAGNSAHFYGFPFPFQETYYEDLLGTFHRFLLVNAIGDFLIFFGISTVALTILGMMAARIRTARDWRTIRTSPGRDRCETRGRSASSAPTGA
jgi:hypothetical protein